MSIYKTLEHRVLSVPFHILTFSGVWCPEHVKPWFKRIYFVFTIFVIILLLIFILEICVYLVITIKKRQFELDVFFIVISDLNGLYKALSILLTRKRITRLLMKGFDKCWRIPRDESEKKILTNFSRESRRIHLIYALACLVAVAVKLIGPMIRSNYNVVLPVPAWYLYNTNEKFWFWLTYIHQLFVGSAIVSIHIGADTMMSGFIFQSCIQLKLLKHRLRNFIKFCKYTSDYPIFSPIEFKAETALIKQYIHDHQCIYSYANSLNHDFTGWMVALLILVIPNICINIYLLSFSKIGINVNCIELFGFLSISLFQIYLPCWYGNEIMHHSIEIKNAMYEIDWINLTSTTRKALIIIMIRAARPIRLTVTHIIPMNVDSFLKIIKASYSVLSVLQRI